MLNAKELEINTAVTQERIQSVQPATFILNCYFLLLLKALDLMKGSTLGDAYDDKLCISSLLKTC